MQSWLRQFRFDPIAPLLAHADTAVSLTARRDLLNERINVQHLTLHPEAQRIVRRQQRNGSWIYPSPKEEIRSRENYNQIETYRNLGYLIEQYSFKSKDPAIAKAAEYLFRFQSPEGDLRGIYGRQYSPNYTAGITELLIKAGYEKDKRIKKVFDWLLSIRQADGGWAIPLRTRGKGTAVISDNSAALAPDVTRPSSHLINGVVLRAFAAHPVMRRSKEAKRASELLSASLFTRDKYPDRADPAYWLRFAFPFWFTDLISAMDSLSILCPSQPDEKMRKAMDWFVRKQKRNGLWDLKVLKGRNRDLTNAWLSLAICRIVKRLGSE